MHELSLAMSLLDGIEQECGQRAELRGRRIAAVHLRVGALSGVNAEALRFAYELAAADTALTGSRLVTEPAPGRELEIIGLELDETGEADLGEPNPGVEAAEVGAAEGTT